MMFTFQSSKIFTMLSMNGTSVCCLLSRNRDPFGSVPVDAADGPREAAKITYGLVGDPCRRLTGGFTYLYHILDRVSRRYS